MLVIQHAHGFEQLTGGSHRARDHRASACVLKVLTRGLSGELGRHAIELCNAIFCLMELESRGIGAEAVGQNDVSTGFEERAVQPEHLLWLLNAPEIRWVARLQSAPEEVRAGGAICHAPASSGNDVSDGVVHRLSSLSVSFCPGRV